MTPEIRIFEMCIILRIELHAHSLSNNSHGFRLMPRRQLLADGREVDALSGGIFKHFLGVNLLEYYQAHQISVCPACAVGDGRRAFALVERPEYANLTMKQIIQQCAMCDSQGFLVPARNATQDNTVTGRQKMQKDTLVEISFGLTLPEQSFESLHIVSRMGDSKESGQMFMKRPVRSGSYAFCVRYYACGVGMDTLKRQLFLTDSEQRLERHKANICALRDLFISPTGALTATMLPHPTKLQGCIVIRNEPGRAPMISALDDSFSVKLQQMVNDRPDEGLSFLPFDSIPEFYERMNQLMDTTAPYTWSDAANSTRSLAKPVRLKRRKGQPAKSKGKESRR